MKKKTFDAIVKRGMELREMLVKGVDESPPEVPEVLMRGFVETCNFLKDFEAIREKVLGTMIKHPLDQKNPFDIVLGPQVRHYIMANMKIDAIKELRAQSMQGGKPVMGLKEAKDCVEFYFAPGSMGKPYDPNYWPLGKPDYID